MASYANVAELFRSVREEKKGLMAVYSSAQQDLVFAQQEHIRLTGQQSQHLEQRMRETENCMHRTAVDYDAKLDRLGRHYQRFRDLMALSDTELRIQSANGRLGLETEDEHVQNRTLSETDYWSAIFNGEEPVKKGWDYVQQQVEEYRALDYSNPKKRKRRNEIFTGVMPYIHRLANEMKRGMYDKKTATYDHGPVPIGKNFIRLEEASVDDLAQDGAAYVLENLHKYDPSRGRFSTWLALYARSGMARGFEQEKNHTRMHATFFWYARKLLRRHPSCEDFIRAIADKSTDELWKRHRGITPVRASLIYLTLTGDYKNIWESRRRDTDSPSVGPLETVLPDQTTPTPEEVVFDHNLAGQIRAVLASLTPREKKVLELRFGIGTDYDKTIEEVGRDFEMTRERIRQIEAKALRKMRHTSRRKPMQDAVW